MKKRANYSFTPSDSTQKKFKRLKEIFLREKFLTDGIDVDNDVIIELNDGNGHAVMSGDDTVDNIIRQSTPTIEETRLPLDVEDIPVAVKEERQSLNHFPNNPKKHIDYVIYYKETTETLNSREIKKQRSKFLKRLKQEQFDLCYVKQDDIEDETVKYVYVLISCSLDRLMDEAERMLLELPLKPVSGLSDLTVTERGCECFGKIEKILKKRLKDDDTRTLCAPFQKDIRYIFQDFQEDVEKSEGFSNTIRCLLVHNILCNLNLDLKEKSNDDERLNDRVSKLIIESGYTPDMIDRLSSSAISISDRSSIGGDFNMNSRLGFKNEFKVSTGLPYMISKHYFNDAFILHDETFKFDKSNEYVLHLLDKEKLVKEAKGGEAAAAVSDIRYDLHQNWARFSNVLSYQPLSKIRNYFGEVVALYFAWNGTLISSLWCISIVGIVFFIVDLIRSINRESKLQLLVNGTATENIAIYSNYYLNTFAGSFDNELTPYYAVIICLWGVFLSHYWKKENDKLSYRWRTTNYQEMEPNRVEYTRKIQMFNMKEPDFSKKIHHYPRYRRYLKYFVSLLILILMILIVALDVALIVVFRIFMKIKVFPDNYSLKIIFGDIVSTLLNLIAILLMDKLYETVAKKLTKWEIPRTHTEYNNLLIFKLFAFEFVNCYGSLFYIAFFRKLRFENGLFNLGHEFQDSCDEDNCMALLTIQVFVILLFKPFPRWIVGVIWPVFSTRYKQYKLIKKFQAYKTELKELFTSNTKLSTAENSEEYETTKLLKAKLRLFINVTVERKKPKYGRTIQKEYMEKVMMYGYVMLFACSFNLGPLLFLIANLIDMRVDAKSILWVYRRPVAHRAETIGIFYYIIQFINMCGIISNSFIIAFTSKWGSKEFNNNTEKRLIFAAIFEHVLFLAWIFMLRLWPSESYEKQLKVKEESQYSKEMIISAKSLKNPHYLSEIVEKLTPTNNYNDTESVFTTSSYSRFHRLPKLDETLDEDFLEEALEENSKKKK